MTPFAIIHIPHAATDIPSEQRDSLTLSTDALQRELLVMTDWYTDELFSVEPSLATVVRYPFSRLVCDPERFVTDAEEPMAKKGMGAIYTRTTEGVPLRNKLSDSMREETLRQFYFPHHKRITEAVGAALQNNSYCLIIDAHSFSSMPLPHEDDQSTPRPDICIGTDDFHTPHEIVSIAERLFSEAGWKVKTNSPFSGAFVPTDFYRKERRVFAIMFEINRSLYMNESNGDKLSSFETFSRSLGATLRHFIAALPQLHLIR